MTLAWVVFVCIAQKDRCVAKANVFIRHVETSMMSLVQSIRLIRLAMVVVKTEFVSQHVE